MLKNWNQRKKTSGAICSISNKIPLKYIRHSDSSFSARKIRKKWNTLQRKPQVTTTGENRQLIFGD